MNRITHALHCLRDVVSGAKGFQLLLNFDINNWDSYSFPYGYVDFPGETFIENEDYENDAYLSDDSYLDFTIFIGFETNAPLAADESTFIEQAIETAAVIERQIYHTIIEDFEDEYEVVHYGRIRRKHISAVAANEGFTRGLVAIGVRIRTEQPQS